MRTTLSLNINATGPEIVYLNSKKHNIVNGYRNSKIHQLKNGEKIAIHIEINKTATDDMIYGQVTIVNYSTSNKTSTNLAPHTLISGGNTINYQGIILPDNLGIAVLTITTT